MAITRKQVLAKIAGRRKAIEYHLVKHIPQLISTADLGLLEYWRKEVEARIAEMESWARRLSKHDQFLIEASEYRLRLGELLVERMRELGR